MGKFLKTTVFILILAFIYIGSVGGCGNNDGSDNGLDGDDDTGSGATTLNITNTGADITVYAQVSGCTQISDWTATDSISCMTMTGDMSTTTCTLTANDTICSFPLAMNQTCTPPINAPSDCTGTTTSDIKIAFDEEYVTEPCGKTPGTGPSVAELLVGGDDCSKTPGCDTPPCDCADISLVQGYKKPNISMTLSKDDTLLGPTVDPTIVTSANSDVFGVFPVGCTNCVNRGGCPCNINCEDTTACHQGGTPDNPDLPCQASQPTGGTVTITILPDPIPDIQ